MQNDTIWYTVTPRDAEYGSEAAKMERVETEDPSGLLWS